MEKSIWDNLPPIIFVVGVIVFNLISIKLYNYTKNQY